MWKENPWRKFLDGPLGLVLAGLIAVVLITAFVLFLAAKSGTVADFN